jgi:hypothetical protein
LIDRELYLPRAWTDDRERARAAGIPDDAPFAIKPELARRLLTGALNAGVPTGWLTADEIYGQDKRLRVWCEQHGMPYELATRSNDTVATVDWRQRRVRALITEVPEVSGLAEAVHFLRYSGMDRSSQIRGRVQDRWYTPSWLHWPSAGTWRTRQLILRPAG